MLIGWDWASQSHDITVLGDQGEVVERFAVNHDEAGFERALTRMRRHGEPRDLPIAIERPNGVVVERLLAAGHPVVPIHPNAFNAARSRWGAARAKSDPGDSYRLADYLRTDGHRLRRLQPLDQQTRQLQALVRMRDDHVEARVAAVNQLQALLDTSWPGAVTIFASLDSDIALNFLDRYSTPDSAQHLGEARLAAFLKRNSYCGRRPASELLRRLRRAPVACNLLEPEVLTDLVRTQVRVVRTLREAIAEMDHAIAAALLEHPKAKLLSTLPRIGDCVNLAQLISELGPILDASLDVDHAAAQCGASPVTKSSGLNHGVHFRWAANNHARKALAIFADNSRHSSRWAACLYARHAALQKRHPHVIRILMRGWLRVIWACWHTNTAYSPQLHGAESRFAPAA